MSKRIRIFAGVLACVALLFARGALAIFACPVEMAAAPTMAAMPDCEQAVGDLSALCAAECQDPPQKFESSHALSIPAAPPSFLPVPVTMLAPAAPRHGAPGAWPHPPPLIVLFGRIRE